MNLQNLNSFNIVLPSNWETNGLYPENRPSHYKTRLVEKIILTGDWEAAMSRISFPVNWENIRLSGTLRCHVDKEEPNESVDPISRFFGQSKPTFTWGKWRAPWRVRSDGTVPPKKIYNSMQRPTEEGDSLAYKSENIILRPGYFPTVHALLEYITHEFKQRFGGLSFQPELCYYIDMMENRVRLYSRNCRVLMNYTPNNELFNLLGFNTEVFDSFHVGNPIPGALGDFKPDDTAIFDLGTGYKTKLWTQSGVLVGDDPPHFDSYREIYIYSDLIGKTMMGNTYVNYLGYTSVPSTARFQEQIVVISPNVTYLPLERNEFDTIELTLADEKGTIIPIYQGVVTITLHLRRRIL